MNEPFSILNQAPWPALLVGAAGKIQKANKAAMDLFGSELEGTASSLDSLWSPENNTTLQQFLKLAEGHSSTVKLRTKSAAADLFLAQSCSLPADNSSLLLQFFPSKQAENQPAVDANTAHKQKLDCALQLARSVSLDFNNALTSILGHTSLLLSKAEVGHPWRSSLVEVEKSAAKAAEIAQDLAAFSRQEKDTRVQTSGNLNNLLQRTVDSFRKPDQLNISWNLRLERKLFSANFDEAKMQQAFMKILENAVQAAGDRTEITVQSRNLQLTEPTQDRTVKLAAATYICVEISDNGSGIPADVLPRIFEPFFTTKGKNHRGLGLTFAYGIVTNHGGGVAVSSEPGVGTSVRIYLPAQAKVVKEAALASSNLGGAETILIVDDEDLLLNMGQMVLSSFGYKALIANSGQKALEILHKENIDLVITDLVMPNMSGRELIEHIRKLTPDIRIICSSGYVRGGNAEDDDGYLQKPFTSQELLRKVRQALSDPS